jgi:hypothetical protein
MSASLIAYTLPAKPNSRLQRYRLTDAGKAKLAQISAVPSSSSGAMSPPTIPP